jgi:CRISPR-associated protein Cmr2
MIYGITIGPIVPTIQKAKKTAEIWAASYIFSYLMKNIAKGLYNNKVKFIVPYIDGTFEEKDGGIGMYHDRLIFESNLNFEKIEEIINEEKDNLAKYIAKAIKYDENEVKKFIRKYIKTYIAAKENSENPILEMYSILDNLEYNEEIYEYKDYIDKFLIRENIVNSSFVKSINKKGFRSIPQIASSASGKDYGYFDEKNNKYNEDEDYYTKLQNELEDDFKQVYKYIAVIHADGDNLGNVVKSLKLDEKKYDNKVSKALFNFGKNAKKILDKYSCDTIFIGGDDLLFFAPVIMKVNDNGKKTEKTILDLLDELKKIYEKEFEFYNKNNQNKTTLSFGVSISYYKYPLTEALNLSRTALFDKAKKLRNAVNISIRKHSGQSFDLRVKFDDKRYEIFKELLRGVLYNKIDIPFSLHYKLNELKDLINLIDNYDSFFENYFNEDIHKNKFKEGLEKIKELIELTPNQNNKQDKDDKNEFGKLEFVYPAVSMIKLLKGRK